MLDDLASWLVRELDTNSAKSIGFSNKVEKSKLDSFG
jgi:hypothetical protein